MKKTFTDMMGREVVVNFPPKRIVSLVPSQTELLYDLGLNNEVTGITKFCIHPNDWFRNKKRVGGTKTVHTTIVKELQPDLIIANKEENTQAQIEELAQNFPVWISDIKNIDDGLQMIREVGSITGKTTEANTIADEIQAGFASLPAPKHPLNVAYFIWRNPWMCAGGDTFISNMIATMGWKNAMADMQRYPELMFNDLRNRQIDMVLLSSEPYPFKDTHIAEIKAVLPQASVMLVDGEMFSWYGSRMRKAVGYMSELILQTNQDHKPNNF